MQCDIGDQVLLLCVKGYLLLCKGSVLLMLSSFCMVYSLFSIDN
uniref:Uncharacterized protein n=1 Tax=Arundo donax TaxID=35708 RepID=A0A0A9AI70_ARUDO